ncbi:T6SS amidase immunity protein Tai4 family protein [Serratia sp. CY47444]|uniref:T6SS amidase immunity protein Tai4 family protein n=1 Tax=Serratia sp. CY47444 TaxID=3383626 RepID=UPI003F9EBC19
MKKILISFFCLYATCAIAQKNQKESIENWPPQAAYRSYLQNYKDIALTYCISVAYKTSPEASKDAIASSNGIDAWSYYAIRDEESPIIALTKQYLQKNYNAKDGKSRLDLMKCMDMYHSENLDKLAKDYIQCPNDNWVKDNPDRVNDAPLGDKK